jgi:hypothetical protein
MDSSRSNELSIACINGDVHKVILLMEDPATNPNVIYQCNRVQTDKFQRSRLSPLGLACVLGHADIVRTLLQNPLTDPNFAYQKECWSDSNGETPLILSCIFYLGAVHENDVSKKQVMWEIISLLLNHNQADLNKNIRDQTDIHTAFSEATCLLRGDDGFVLAKFLLDQPKFKQDFGVLDRCFDTKFFGYLLDHPKIDPNIQDADGNTLMHKLLTDKPHFDRAVFFPIIISHPKTNPNIKNHNLESILQLASRNGSVETVEQILSNTKTNPLIMDNYHRTALFTVAKWNRTDIAEVLMKNPHVKHNKWIGDIDGRTPIGMAIEFGSYGVAKCLIGIPKWIKIRLILGLIFLSYLITVFI